MSLLEKIKTLEKKKVLVIGDVMLDQYEYGEVSRISPEAPVQVVKFTDSKYVLGGAANTAHNLASLSAEVSLIGVAGLDENRKILSNLLDKAKIYSQSIITDETRLTTVKKRIVAGKSQLLRVDYEKIIPASVQVLRCIERDLELFAPNADSIVVSEYGKGMITGSVMKMIKAMAAKYKVPLVVDGKPNNFEYFQDVFLITPNLKEAEAMSGIQDDVEQIGKTLVKKLNANVFLTQGAEGISVFEKNGKITRVPTKKVPVYDVTGAGDTVVAVSALGLASELQLVEIAELANIAGRIVVQKPGTATVTLDEIKNTIDSITIRESYETHEKAWGYEEWIINMKGAGYCGKKLVLNKGYQCSIHWHEEKDEVFYINQGYVLMIMDGKKELMKPNSRIRIEPGTKHRFIGLTNAEIIEFSSFHKEEDSYRDEPSGKVDDSIFEKYLQEYSLKMRNN
jgi:rfaE bifunctional protein kinase chain/domain